MRATVVAENGAKMDLAIASVLEPGQAYRVEHEVYAHSASPWCVVVYDGEARALTVAFLKLIKTRNMSQWASLLQLPRCIRES